MRDILFIIAPDIPYSEKMALDKRLREALDGTGGPMQIVAANYDIQCSNIQLGDGDALLVSAPDVPPSEIVILKAAINKALSGEEKFVLVNYHVRLTVIRQKLAL